jgi:hypothetical protein
MGCRRCVEAKSVRSSRLDQVGSDVPGSNEYQGRRDRKKALALRMENVSEWMRATR